MTERQELWHQLDGESFRAYSAFRTYLYELPERRTLTQAYRQFTENKEATYAPRYFGEWSTKYAWQERALAYDRHIQLLREEGHEEAIREEAKQQSTQVESRRNRYNELMTSAYNVAMEWLEDSEWAKQNMKSTDVVKIVALHLEDQKVQRDLAGPTDEEAGRWTEEDEEDVADIVARVDAAAEGNGAAGDETREAPEAP